MHSRFVATYRIAFVFLLLLYVLLMNLAHFHRCEGNCLRSFIVVFDLFWLWMMAVILDMYHGRWGHYRDKRIFAVGSYWLGWLMIVMCPPGIYYFAIVPLLEDGFRYVSYHETGYSRGRMVALFYDWLGNRFGMWLPASWNFLLGTLLAFVGWKQIKKRHEKPAWVLLEDSRTN